MDIRAIALGVSFALIWSSAFTSARIIVLAAPPLAISSIRFLIAGTIAIAIAYALGQRIKFAPKQWRAIIVFGLCQNAIYLGLFFMAMQRIEASAATIIASTMPLWVAGFAMLFMGDRLRPFALIGLILGVLGTFLIMGSRLSGGMDPMGIVLGIIGVLALSVATLSVKSASAQGHLLMVVGLQMWVGGLALLPFAMLFETWHFDWSTPVIVALLYTILLPGLVATYIWFVLVGRVGAIRAATYHFLNPFFGVSIAALILGERLSIIDVIGVMIVTLGIYLVQTNRVAQNN